MIILDKELGATIRRIEEKLDHAVDAMQRSNDMTVAAAIVTIYAFFK